MFGIKVILKNSDKQFLSYPFVPASFCVLNDREGQYFIAGYGKQYKRTSDKTWVPV